MREFEIAELFEVEYEGDKRWCAVIKLFLYLEEIPFYHNGYVQTKNNEHISDISMFSEEITFDGKASFLEAYLKDINMLGFDSIHLCDNKETQSFDNVRERTIKLAYEMIKEGI